VCLFWIDVAFCRRSDAMRGRSPVAAVVLGGVDTSSAVAPGNTSILVPGANILILTLALIVGVVLHRLRWNSHGGLRSHQTERLRFATVSRHSHTESGIS
jgi:hypothetical protein